MRISSRCLLLCFLTLGFSIHALAYSDWLPITPEDLKMTSISQQPGAPAAVLYHEEIDDDTHSSQSIYTRIKILTDAGKKYADVEIPYNRGFLSINSLRGRTIQPDGTISNFEGKPFDRVLVKGNGLKWRVKVFTMPNVQVGSIVEYRYFRDYADHTAVQPEWDLQGDLFRIKQYFCFIPTTHDLILAHGETGHGISWTFSTPKNTVPVDNQRGKIELTLTDTPAFIEEPDMPPVNTFRYNVHFYYDLHHAKAADFWKDEGKYWNKDAEKFMDRRNGLSEAVHSTVAASDTSEQKARKIYSFVQGLQNLNYSTSRSEQELRTLKLKAATGVEDVLRQKMGDSEDLARLYVAMAREAGLTAYLMRVASTDHDSIFNENYLSFNQLDHEIAIVKLETGEVKLDPGVRYCPFGLLYWKHSDTRGLRQTASKATELATVEPNKYADAWLHRDADFKLLEDGQMEGMLRVTYQGQRALMHRIENWNTDEAGRKKFLEEEIKGWLPSNAEVTLTNRPNWEATGDLLATFHITTPAASSAGHRTLLPLDIFQLNNPPRFTHTERYWPIVFTFPYRTTDHLRITLPDGFAMENMPAPVKLKLPYALYSMQLANQAKIIESLRDLVMGSNVFRKESYPELKSFYDQAKAGDDLQVVLKGVANVAGN